MRQLVVVLVLLFAAMPADAQRRRHKTFAQQGDVALVAEIAGLQLRGFSPALGGVGLRYRLADQTVLGVGMGGQFNDDTQTRQTGDQLDEVGSERAYVGGVVWLEQHLGRPRRSVSPFVGGGISLTHGSQSSRNAFPVRTCTVVGGEPVCETETYINEQSSESTTVGGGLILGAEVRVASGITLAGAYGVGVGYSWREAAQTSTLPDNPLDQSRTTEGLAVGTRAPTLTLSIYF